MITYLSALRHASTVYQTRINANLPVVDNTRDLSKGLQTVTFKTWKKLPKIFAKPYNHKKPLPLRKLPVPIHMLQNISDSL